MGEGGVGERGEWEGGIIEEGKETKLVVLERRQRRVRKGEDERREEGKEGEGKEGGKDERESFDKAFLLATAITDFIILSIWCPLVATPPDLHVPGTEEELSV